MSTIVQEPNYKKFSNRVCNLREAGFIGIGFLVAVVALLAIILGIYFGTNCAEDQYACQDGYTCVKKTAWCDGNRDCPVGEDETHCYPSKFYVSFKSSEYAYAINGTLVSTQPMDPDILSDRNLTYYTLVQTRMAELNSTAFELLRFRKVNESSQNFDNVTDTEIQGFLAVDSIVSFRPFGSVCDTRDSNVIREENITQALNKVYVTSGGIQIDPSFTAPGPGVTTGVSAVLVAKTTSTCKRPRVYCGTYCRAYQFSTKGCPSYPCTCVSDESLKTACTAIGKQLASDNNELAKE